jgi:hypothetical protein
MRAIPCAFFEPSRGRGEIGTLCQFSWFLSSGLQGPYFCGCQTARTEEVKEEARMRMLLRDIVLFSCLVAFVAGLVIAAATLLI